MTTYCRGVPIGAKKFSPIPTVMDLEIDFPKSPPKRTWAQNASFQTKCSISVAQEPPISLPSHSRFDTGCLGPERRWSKKIDTEARPSPGTARRCTGAFRAERVPLHQQDSEIGRIRAQFARSRAWSGRGGLHSPDFHPGGPRIFSSTLCTTVWENTRRGAKNPPALHFARVFSGERNTRSCGLRKFLPPPGDKDRVQREHFIGSIFLGLKMLSWALNVAGRSPLAL